MPARSRNEPKGVRSIRPGSKKERLQVAPWSRVPGCKPLEDTTTKRRSRSTGENNLETEAGNLRSKRKNHRSNTAGRSEVGTRHLKHRQLTRWGG